MKILLSNPETSRNAYDYAGIIDDEPYELECLASYLSSLGIHYREGVAADRKEAEGNREKGSASDFSNQTEWLVNEAVPYDIRQLPWADRSMFYENREKYCYLELRPCAIIRTAFCCPYSCAFCYRNHLNCGKYVTRDIEDSKVFAVPVTDEQYEDIQALIDRCAADDEQIFNLFAMLTTPILHGVRIYKAHNCMDFTARVIELAGVKLEKPFYKYDIPDIERLLEDYPHKQGYIKRIDSPGYEHYVEKSNIFKI